MDTYTLRGPAPGTLIRIGSDGSVVELGNVAGLPNNSIAGEFGPGGVYYVLIGTNRLFRINVQNRTSTEVTLSQALNVQDLAWHNGALYTATANGGSLYRITPSTGQVTLIGATGVPSGAFGGMFGATNGVFGGNNAGGFYRFDIQTGAATLISDLRRTENNDGAKCVSTPLEFPVDLSITKDDGGTTYRPGLDATYTIVVSNNGPFGVQNARISDPLPAGITSAQWTCGNATGGAQCGQASGTGSIDTTANLPVNGSVTYTLSMGVPASFTGSLTNTATVTAPDGSPDIDLSNNTASDTNTMEQPPVSGACSPRPVQPSSTFTLAPFSATGSVQKTGSWQPSNPWATTGGDFSWTVNFNQPVPAE